jgi:hypothetical protein
MRLMGLAEGEEAQTGPQLMRLVLMRSRIHFRKIPQGLISWN